MSISYYEYTCALPFASTPTRGRHVCSVRPSARKKPPPGPGRSEESARAEIELPRAERERDGARHTHLSISLSRTPRGRDESERAAGAAERRDRSREPPRARRSKHAVVTVQSTQHLTMPEYNGATS
eukprot:3430474-Prymnesium_polylepis.2